ncbi:hypothetical protein Q5H92_15305 [Hymenobacter sp. M29]|uniref:Uncharacterized protein n=1 Tax=Hymenobacter mellowenesis TaxID=3063995 RepID=A0ABT9AD05_9BACT|nr:hypothetical protein [Hymenobacter sp. M29]MDO7847736.1 hypothetical protein [Hymenobacter sp. M29]
MSFEVMPVLDAMLALYDQPRDQARFQRYLQLLGGGNQADLVVPVMHFNPMAKEPLVTRLRELQQLGAEDIAAEALQEAGLWRGTVPAEPHFRVALNLADDVAGGWTNRYTTDFASKFELKALVKRGFCTPVFWASEEYSPALVRQRVLAQVWRTRYYASHVPPRTVAEHLAQEVFVAQRVLKSPGLVETDFEGILARYEAVKAAIDMPTLLTFFYGDAATRQLGHAEWEHWPVESGFELARLLAAGLR